MRLRTRFTALIVGLMALTVFATTVAMAVNTRERVMEQGIHEARLLAQVLTQAAQTAWFVPDSVEDIVTEQMVTQAKLTARYIQAAEKAGMSEDEINYSLTDIVYSTSVDEFWITDEKGRAYLRSDDFEISFSPDPEVQPQAYIYWPLLTGDREIVVGQVEPRDYDGRLYKYVGVTGFDKPRIVQVGYEANFFDEIAKRVGLDKTIESFMELNRLHAIWVYDENMVPVTFQANDDLKVPAPVTETVDVGDEYRPLQRKPSEREMAALYQSLELGEIVVIEGDEWLSITAPITDRLHRVVGATLMYISLDSLGEILKASTLTTVQVAFVVLLVGVAFSLTAARRVTEPVEAIAAAAVAVERDNFETGMLGRISERSDELGNLGRIITRMASTLAQREEELAEMVMQRTEQLEDKARALTEANNQIAEELRIAQTLQTAILPEERLQQSDYEVQAVMKPAQLVGGDFYDYMIIDEHRIGIVIADVSGKGVPAAFFMAVARTTLHALALGGDRPSDVIHQANNVLCGVNPMGLFVTVYYAIFDRRTGKLTYVNAGHNPPCFIRANGEVEFMPITGGVALGVMPDLEYDEGELVMGPGDMLFTYTDGFTEAFDAHGQEFGEKRLVEGIKTAMQGAPQSAQSLSEHATNAVRLFVGDAEQSDDLTSLTLHFIGSEGSHEVITDRELIVYIKNDLSEVPHLLESVEKLGSLADLPTKTVFETSLVLDEIITNIVNYAYEDDGEHRIMLGITVGSDFLRLTVEDDGKPFNPLIEVDAPELDASLEDRKIGGLGVHFMKSLMEDVTYSWQDGRNRLMMKKRIVRED